MAALVAAIRRYREHPVRRPPGDPPVIWREGSSRLLDHGGRSDAPVMLIVPSLVNRHTVLDLCPERSFVGLLRQEGLRPLVVDWGLPDAAERRFDLTAYVLRLERALDATLASSGKPVVLAGYCMGGLLATALATRRSEAVAALALLATPWDFHAEAATQARMLAASLPLLEAMIGPDGAAPAELLQTLFFAIDPFAVVGKFLRFGALPAGDPAEAPFVLLEDWLADGVPLAGPVFRECVEGWYGRNDPLQGSWRIAGEPVDPTSLRLPTLIAAPARDRIVPPGSAAALAQIIPGAVSLTPPLGHVGMVAGRSAHEHVARPLASWILSALRGCGEGGTP